MDFNLLKSKPTTTTLSKNRTGSVKSEPNYWFKNFGEMMKNNYGQEVGDQVIGNIHLAYLTLMSIADELTGSKQELGH